ncbi:hypothetical protein [uncultured Duncaniella sp.]|uniref:hypothetical protein n=3 Tax=uncultured Duncaniella sp. TaxID=2768039 RepID=UPI0025A4E9A5|nr:hypothetical protein [Bacteroides acidifaciens]
MARCSMIPDTSVTSNASPSFMKIRSLRGIGHSRRAWCSAITMVQTLRRMKTIIIDNGAIPNLYLPICIIVQSFFQFSVAFGNSLVEYSVGQSLHRSDQLFS